MSFSRPTLKDLINQALADLTTRVTGLEVRLRRSFEAALAYCFAALAHGLYGYLFYLSQQILPTAPSGPATVRAWGEIIKLPPKDASFAKGTAIFTGTNGSPIPIGTTFQRADGITYVTTSAMTIASGSAIGPVQAVLSGASANSAASTILTIVNPVTGVNQNAVVDGGGLSDGADSEDPEDYRGRVLEQLALRPTGGGPGDYALWAKRVSGVTRAWSYPLEMGAGTVVVRFATDNDISPIPSPAKVAEVQAMIDSLKPETAVAYVVAPIAYNINPTITITPNTTTVKSAAEIELKGYLRRTTKPAGIAGAALYKSQLDEAVSLAAGETDHTISVPSGNVALTTGQMPILGTVNWV